LNCFACFSPSRLKINLQASSSRLLLAYLLASAALAQQPVADPVTAFDRKPSDYLNERLPSWLAFSGEFRLRFEHAGSSGINNPEEGFLLGRTRFDLAVQPLTRHSY